MMTGNNHKPCTVNAGLQGFFTFSCTLMTKCPPTIATLPQPHQMALWMATAAPYDPHTHVTDVEAAEKHFHVPAMSSGGA